LAGPAPTALAALRVLECWTQAEASSLADLSSPHVCRPGEAESARSESASPPPCHSGVFFCLPGALRFYETHLVRVYQRFAGPGACRCVSVPCLCAPIRAKVLTCFSYVPLWPWLHGLRGAATTHVTICEFILHALATEPQPSVIIP
jgi:hypothetical protein